MSGGDTIQTEDFGASGKIQRVKLVIGSKDTDDGDIASSNPAPVAGNVASGATDSGNPVKTGGVYHSTAPTLSDGQRGDTQLDASANQKITLATLIAGEDLTNNVLKVEERFSYASITSNATTTVKSGAGFLHRIVINTKGASSNTATIYDNTAGSGTKIGTLDTTGGTASLTYNCAFSTGLTIVTSTGTSADLTVIYR